ncbi:MAG: hypothetical protein ACR2LN_01290 [Candidatus Levyibacteriota bacterium]
MAQLNIFHFTDITNIESSEFTLLARDIAAKEIHGLEKSEVQPDSVSVMVIPVDRSASLSGADTEVQVQVSGNNWPYNGTGEPANAVEAKAHFDKMAEKIYSAILKKSKRKVYIWVTPFTASGWAS